MKLKSIYIIMLGLFALPLQGQTIIQQCSIQPQAKTVEVYPSIRKHFLQPSSISMVYDTLFYMSSTGPFSMNYRLAKKEHQYDLLDKDGLVLLTIDAFMPRCMGSFLLVKSNGRWGLVNGLGQIIVPIECSAIAWYGNLLALKKQQQWILLNAQSGSFKEVLYDSLQAITIGEQLLLRVQKKNKWGLINQELFSVLPCHYECIQPLLVQPEQQNHVLSFFVKKASRWGLFSLANGLVIEHQYHNLQALKNQGLLFQDDQGWGIMNREGTKWIKSCSFIEEIDNQLYKVVKGGKVGLFKLGEGLLLPIEYSSIALRGAFYEVEKEGQRWQIHPRTKQAVTLPKHEQIKHFSYQYYQIKIDGLWGLIRPCGRLVVAPKYDSIGRGALLYNRAIVKRQDLYGLIDSLGQEQLMVEYHRIMPLLLTKEKELFFVVTKGQHMGILTKEGDICLPLIYNQISTVYNSKNQPIHGLLKVKQGKKEGIYSLKQQQFILPLNYAAIKEQTIASRTLIQNLKNAQELLKVVWKGKPVFFDLQGNVFNGQLLD